MEVKQMEAAKDNVFSNKDTESWARSTGWAPSKWIREHSIAHMVRQGIVQSAHISIKTASTLATVKQASPGKSWGEKRSSDRMCAGDWVRSHRNDDRRNTFTCGEKTSLLCWYKERFVNGCGDEPIIFKPYFLLDRDPHCCRIKIVV